MLKQMALCLLRPTPTPTKEAFQNFKGHVFEYIIESQKLYYTYIYIYKKYIILFTMGQV